MPEIKTYKQYIFKNGQFRKTASGGAEIRVVDELPTVGEENVLYVLDGSKLSARSQHDFTLKSMTIEIDTSDAANWPTEDTLNLKKRDMIKYHFNNDDVFDYDNADIDENDIRHRMASNYYLHIISTPIDDDFIDAISAGKAVMRFDYPTLTKNYHGWNQNYKGPGRVGYCRDFSEDLKYRDILEDSLIYITANDIKEDANGQLYVDKRISLFDIIKNGYNFYYCGQEMWGKRISDYEARLLNKSELQDMPISYQKLAAQVKQYSDNDGEYHHIYCNNGTAYGPMHASDFNSRSSKYLWQQAKNAGDNVFGLGSQAAKRAPFRAIFPIMLGQNLYDDNIDNSYGVSSPYLRTKNYDNACFNHSSEANYVDDRLSIGVHMYPKSRNYRNTHRSVMVPQFAILDGDTWEKTYSRSDKTLAFNFCAVYIFVNDLQLSESCVFINTIATIVNRL